MEDLSRRTFLRGALLAGAGAVGAGALTACAPQTTPRARAPVHRPPPTTRRSMETTLGPSTRPRSLPRTWKKRFRPISSSSGWASPAWRPPAPPSKRARPSSRREVREAYVRSGDFAIMGGETMKRWGRENIVDIDEACDHEVEEGSYFPKRSIYTKWAKHSGEAFDWYLEAVPDIYYAESSIAEIPDGVEQYITPYFVPLPDGYDFTKEAFPCYPSSVSCYPDQKFIFEGQLGHGRRDGADGRALRPFRREAGEGRRSREHGVRPQRRDRQVRQGDREQGRHPRDRASTRPIPSSSSSSARPR